MFTYQAIRNYSNKIRFAKKNAESIKKIEKYPNLALEHFDGLYSKVYGRSWPSMRLGLLSPKKQSLVLNTFIDTDKIHEELIEQQKAIDMQRYYKKHLQSYTRWQLRQQIIENKKARKRELLAKNANVDVESIDPNSIEVSDVSDSELKGYRTTTSGETEGFSSAEDLFEMFTDRRMDDDEKYFINRASTQLSLNDYVPATEFIYKEEVTDEISYYQGYDPDEKLDVEFRDEPSFETDPQLKIYTFPRASWSKFTQPTITPQADLLSYYLLDGASILPVLALDLRPNDICADYCAAPGGKALAMLMTLKPKYLLCNDSSQSRLVRLSRVIKQYIPDISYVRSTLEISGNNARALVKPDAFDKILVDVPCSNDRNSVEVIENNIFKRARTEERLQLPSIQTEILRAALKSLRPKGSVVYSTCTMSPLENDNVVKRALIKLQEEGSPLRFAVINLKEAYRPFRGLFRFNTKFTYGQQVVPNICSNFGPMYISKIKRIF